MAIDLKCSFLMRFGARLAGLDFTAETEADDYADAVRQYERITKLSHITVERNLTAAQFLFDLEKPDNGGCYLLEDESAVLLTYVLENRGLGIERYENQTMGSYDRFMNRVTAADMGMVFPDGSLRVVLNWDNARIDFQAAFIFTKTLLEVILQMQDMPYFKATEEEEDNSNASAASARMKTALFDLGLWPADDDTYKRRKSDAVLTKALSKYAKMGPATAPALSAATA
jgi:hypothetical protein